MGTLGVMYGVVFSDEELKERRSWHKTTYLEWEIPEELDKELSKIISKKIRDFEKKCNCGRCKLHRQNRKQ